MTSVPNEGRDGAVSDGDRAGQLLAAHAHVRTYRRLFRALREHLEQHGLTVTAMELLCGLLEPRTERRQLSHLAAELDVSLSALSRAVSDLEDADLVRRTARDGSRREVYVRLTSKGRRLVLDAIPGYLAVITAHQRGAGGPPAGRSR